MGGEISLRINRRMIGWVVGCIVTSLFFYLTCPMWHWLFFSLFYRHIGTWIATVAVFAVEIYYLKWVEEKVGMRETQINLGYAGMAILCLLLWVGCFFWSINTYGVAVAYSFEPERVSEIPDTQEVRYLPYEVALTLAKARQQDPTKQVGDIDPLLLEDGFYWVAPRIPNGIWNWLTQQADGILLIGETGSMRFEQQPFRYGEGMGISDGLAWQLRAKRYVAEYPEIFYIPWDDRWLGVAPYVTYRFVFPVFIPHWGGVMVINPDGRIEDLSPAEAQEDPRLVGRRLFPEKLARAYSGSWGYREGGLLNILFTHRDQVEIADLVNTDNEMPYFLPTPWGPQWMTAVEPSGPSQSIFKIFWFDVQTGKARLTEFTEEDALIGPNKGEAYARAETPGYTWREKEEGTYYAVEPRPVIRDKFFWMYSVTTSEYTGVGVTVLLDGRDSEHVLHFCSRENLKGWLAGERGPDSLPCTAVVSEKELPVEIPIGCEELWQKLQQAVEARDAAEAARIAVEILATCQ